MKILHLLASPYWSGPAENVALLALAQRELGHEVEVAIDRKRTRTTSEELAAPRFRELGLLGSIGEGLELSVKSSPAAVWRDVSALRRSDAEVLHAHFSHDHLLARFARRKGQRLVRSIHAPRSIRWSLPNADAYTVCAPDLLRRLRGRRVALLPALRDPRFRPAADRNALRAALGVGRPGKLIGMVSTFQASRRHDVGVAAFARLAASEPAARLVLVGDGLVLPQVRRDVAQRGLADRVTFTGYQSGADFLRWLQALDEVWVLGLGNDWSGRVAAQARACGVRVIAVDEGGLSAFADVVLTAPDPAELEQASRAEVRAERPLATNLEIATQVLALYGG